MPRYRLFAVDLDGTLLTSDKRLTPRCVEAIGSCRRSGVDVVICTARPPRSARPFYDRLGLDTELVAYNGAMVTHPPSGAVLAHRSMSSDLSRGVLETVLSVEAEAVVTFEKADQWYTDERGARIVTDTAAAGFSPDVVCELWECVASPVTKMLVSKDPGTVRGVRSALEREWAGQVSIMQCDDYLLQIAAAGVSKAAALEQTLRSRGLGRGVLAAIGDAPNDIAMLEFAAMGIAVANAPESVKGAAQAVVSSNDDDGVAAAVERYVL